VVAKIKAERPAVVLAPHVETSSGIVISDDYIKVVSDATHANGSIFVLDCVASGCQWIDMEKLGVDVLITAPQKGWSGTPGFAIIMLSQAGIERVNQTDSSSFCIDLKKWYAIMKAYEGGGFAYHATMPTDSIAHFANLMKETQNYGFDRALNQQLLLGSKMRALLKSRGFVSVAAEGCGAASVIVVFTSDPDMKSGKRFQDKGVQIAPGVPLELNEGPEYMSFRIGLFGLDKLYNIPRTHDQFAEALSSLGFGSDNPTSGELAEVLETTCIGPIASRDRAGQGIPIPIPLASRL